MSSTSAIAAVDTPSLGRRARGAGCWAGCHSRCCSSAWSSRSSSSCRSASRSSRRLQGGFSAASDALDASSTPTLLAAHGLVAARRHAARRRARRGRGAGSSSARACPAGGSGRCCSVAPLTMPLFVTSYAWATLSDAAAGLPGAPPGSSRSPTTRSSSCSCAVALRGMDPALEETARSLGLNARQTFFRVVLPQLRPALLGGMLLVVLDTLVEFDAFVALKFQTFSVTSTPSTSSASAPRARRRCRSSRSSLCVLAAVRRVAAARRRQLHAGQPGRAPAGSSRYRLGRWTPLVLVVAARRASRSASGSRSGC